MSNTNGRVLDDVIYAMNEFARLQASSGLDMREGTKKIQANLIKKMDDVDEALKEALFSFT
jgi:hypothetical protein